MIRVSERMLWSREDGRGQCMMSFPHVLDYRRAPHGTLPCDGHKKFIAENSW